jgi:hypothetical protein
LCDKKLNRRKLERKNLHDSNVSAMIAAIIILYKDDATDCLACRSQSALYLQMKRREDKDGRRDRGVLCPYAFRAGCSGTLSERMRRWVKWWSGSNTLW